MYFGIRTSYWGRKTSYTVAIAMGVNVTKSCDSDFEISQGENNSASRDL